MECESRVQELKKMAALKINQRDEVIEEYNEKRKRENNNYQLEILELKSKIKIAEENNQEKEKNLRMLSRNQ